MAQITKTGNHKEAGFTLIELLVVLLIIGLLAGLVGVDVYKNIDPAKRSIAQTQINNFGTALDSFMLDIGRYPTTEEGLNALRTPTGSGWNGVYLKKEIPLDPWGNPYIYKSPSSNGGYEITSYGADGKSGGSDENSDINSWEN